MLWGSSLDLEVHDHLEAGFKNPELHGCGKFHDLEGPVHGVREPKEEWIRSLMFKFLEAQKTFPRVIYFGTDNVTTSPGEALSSTYNSCRQKQRNRRPGDGGTPQQELPDSKRRRSIDGNPV